MSDESDRQSAAAWDHAAESAARYVQFVRVETVGAAVAADDSALAARLVMRARQGYRIASMHWSDSGAVRVVWERR